MSSRLRCLAMRMPLALGSIAVLSLVPLLVWDAAPSRFPSGSHDLLGSGPLLLIAAAYLTQQLLLKRPLIGWLRVTIVVLAFVAWAANQCRPDHWFATGWNDIAIALFVVDVFLSVQQVPGSGVAEPAAHQQAPAEAAASAAISAPSNAAR